MPALSEFIDPPAAFRPAPLWVWNDEMTEDRIVAQLREMKKGGFGGAFVHPRPGLITEYLSEDWFILWGIALREAQRLDFKLNIYDENSYPSGFGGGHVSAQLPDCAASSVKVRFIGADEAAARGNGVAPLLAGHIRAFACEPIGMSALREAEVPRYRIVADVTYEPYSRWNELGDSFLVFEEERFVSTAWLGGFSYMDLMRPEVAEKFIETTYEAYAKRFGDSFGSDVTAIFTDEPAVAGSAVYSASPDSLPFSYWFAVQFRKRNGYRLEEHLPCLFYDAYGAGISVEPTKVRFDYYETVRELWSNNFVRAIGEWCKGRGIAYTGHFMEHHWPSPSGMASPAVMSLYEFMEWPAIDCLMARMLSDDARHPLMLTVLEAASVANQLGKPRVLCESFGASGWDSCFADYKRIGDWLAVHGVNFFNPHFTAGSIVGARKRDHPQSFDWRQSWWPEFAVLNAYFGRLSYALSKGAARNRVLVLHPTTTAFLYPPGVEAGSVERPDNPPIRPDFRGYLAMLQHLADELWDFDLGDEFILERHGGSEAVAESAKLRVGIARYEVAVVPEGMANMRSSTIQLLENLLERGGRVAVIGEPGPYVDGINDPAAYRRLLSLPGILRIESGQEVSGGLMELGLEPRFQWESEVTPGIHHLRRELEDGSAIVLFTNCGRHPASAVLGIRGAASAERWNLLNGQTESLADAVTGAQDGIRLTVKLEGTDSLLLRLNPLDAVPSRATDPAAAAKEARTIKLDEGEAIAESDNVLVLDYGDFDFGDGSSWQDVHAIHAGWLLYQNRGFAANPWDNAIQYKRRIVDRNRHYGEDSGFVCTYRFKIAEGGIPSRLRLAAERSAYYQLKVNGAPVAWLEGETWLDPDIGVADIAAVAFEGWNTVELVAPRFDVRLEIEPVYVLGAFGLAPRDGVWTIESPRALGIGAWKSMGYPFYSGAVRYRHVVELDRKPIQALLELKRFEGAVVSVIVNGSEGGLIGLDGSGRLNISPWLRPGSNEIVVRVSGTMKNTLGPHHDAELPRKAAWPVFWKRAPMQGQPAAEAYDLLDQGLLEPADLQLIFS
ncbi:glycosyl hydrolase [Paenibacillus sp. YIM B09110]|uniref:glycosyl hydrolase n=1 Tax=Paenibacillus sp. YIM B09110 TaxID=3126102 RepID=UPI00301C58F2